MAKRSKHLGLGKAAKTKKKQKVESSEESAENVASNELTVELNDEVDADDEIAQVVALWQTYSKSEKENELVLNGIIHECDRILRNSSSNTDESKQDAIPDYFHSVYALALADLALFHTEEEKIDKIDEFFQASLERIELGLEKYPNSIDLLFAKSRILINRIPLQYISKLTLESKKEELKLKLEEKLDEALSVYGNAESKAIERKDGTTVHFTSENLTFLEALDDLLDIVDNFGKEKGPDEDDDDEDEENDEDKDDDEDENDVELSESHPLYEIATSDKYNQWWRDHTVSFLDQVSVETNAALYRELCKRLGQSYLQEADIPSSVYTTLTYDDDYEGITELQGLTTSEAQKIAQELFQTACGYFEKAEDKDEPETWVPVAEAKISLGNMYNLEDPEQEKLYKDAEKILRRANKATQGKYQDILDNLIE
ncbi:enhancer of translation termination 1 [[Candida] railenensis]|uniref:Enhancer of translation termination 1 n=1 Tax=[Candida] railenensis TaxID=45579 RepID=A0A9P0QQU1_9ASCO|nr:enhancer of translation termination 1 [[Candida] railenensis]